MSNMTLNEKTLNKLIGSVSMKRSAVTDAVNSFEAENQKLNDLSDTIFGMVADLTAMKSVVDEQYNANKSVIDKAKEVYK